MLSPSQLFQDPPYLSLIQLCALSLSLFLKNKEANKEINQNKNKQARNTERHAMPQENKIRSLNTQAKQIKQ